MGKDVLEILTKGFRRFFGIRFGSGCSFADIGKHYQVIVIERSRGQKP
jgi:hypothetical protein